MALFRSFPSFSSFITVLVALLSVSIATAQLVTREQIRQSSARCCPEQFRECCEQRLLKDERIHCPKALAGGGELLSEERALAMAICLEKELHGGQSVIEKRAHKCCWLLSGGQTCQSQCYDKLRAPSIAPAEKFTFTDECPPLTLNRTVPISEMNQCFFFFRCLTDREAVVHSCFSVCLHWWDNNWATQAVARHGRTFDPLRDCADFVELNKPENCLVPAYVLLKLGLMNETRNNGTSEKLN
ncbi:hypothetical protein niasHT_002113 [Heterodera trifolii]|uniref:Uncharacterized protein n=1 Tax=Heterodera trifolii TaxID=157864 RepID=A0ABD2MCY9_9BILA